MANDKKKRREEETVAKANYVGGKVRVKDDGEQRVVRNYGIKPLYQRLNEKRAVSRTLGEAYRDDRTAFVKDAMSGGIAGAMQNQQKRQNQRTLDMAIDSIRSGKITPADVDMSMKDAPEIVAPGYGYKKVGGKAVYTTPSSPLPDPKKAKTATRAQAPGAFGISPDDYSKGMKAFRDYDEFSKREKPQATYDTLDNEGAKNFIDKWFPEKQGQLPTQDEMLAKWSQLDPFQQDSYWMEYQNAGAAIEEHERTAEADAAAYEKEKARTQADRDAAIKLLGEDAPNYAGESDAKHMERFAKTYGMSEAAQQYAQEYQGPGLYDAYNPDVMAEDPVSGKTRYEHDAVMWGIMHPGEESPFEGTKYETGRKILNREMTDEQKYTYMALAKVYGEQAAQDWYKSMLTDEGYNERAYWENDEALRAGANESWLEATGRSFANVPLQLRGVAYGLEQAIKGEKIDPYASAFVNVQAVQTPRDEVQQMITQEFGTTDETGAPKDTFISWLMKAGYQAGTSGGDSLLAAPLNFIAPGAGAITQGLWGSAGTIQDTAMRDASSWESMLSYGINAAIETLTEWIPMDHFIKTLESRDIRTIGDIFRNAAKAGLLDAPGEGLSELGGYLSDKLIMGEMSNWDALVNEKGTLSAAKQVAWDVFNSMFVGYLSGAGNATLAGSKAAVKNAWSGRNAETNAQTQETPAQPEPVQPKQVQEQQPKEKKPVKTAENAKIGNPLRQEREVTVKRGNVQQQMTVTGVETVSGGNVFLSVKNEDGDAEVVSAADVEFADPAMNELAASPQLTRMDGKTASVFLEGYDASLATPQEYAQAFESAYQDGKAGLEYERMMQHDQQAMKYLPSNVRQMAYTRGAAALIQKHGDKYKKGGVVKKYTGAAWRQMTGEQKKRARANMELANVIGRRMGKAIEVVDEIVVDGVKANAMYDRRTGTIRVALDADAQAYAYAAMHELTHALKNEHAEEYQALENFVAGALDRKGQSLADLMDEQIERYGLKPEEALEEVICNTVPALLRDEQNVMELYKGNRTLFERVMDWVRQLLDDVQATGEMLSKGSADWAQMDVLKDSREDLQKMLQMMEAAFDSEGKEKGHPGDEDGMADDNVVKLSRQEGEYDPETAAIKQQIENSRDKLNRMDPVATASVPENIRDKREAGRWAIDILKSTGYQVDRQGFGVITFNENDIKYCIR